MTNASFRGQRVIMHADALGAAAGHIATFETAIATARDAVRALRADGFETRFQSGFGSVADLPPIRLTVSLRIDVDLRAEPAGDDA
ncbi:MAG: hypothetical protein CMO29_02055 [Tistrella sp.]|nr:hypothetical protein [Tistrella sp.]|tara:strand:- start:1944 stop:2201 length:258 start_codon:yes stop_codon:yes gene_type:complete